MYMYIYTCTYTEVEIRDGAGRKAETDKATQQQN